MIDDKILRAKRIRKLRELEVANKELRQLELK